ncbi:hypothetical protein FDZ74_17570, partial [bacterium]
MVELILMLTGPDGIDHTGVVSDATLEELIRAADLLLGSDSLRLPGVVVIDDVADADGRFIAEVSMAARLLSRLGLRWIVTLKDEAAVASGFRCHAVVLDSGDLALMPEEAHALTEGLLEAERSVALADACAGHIALFALLVKVEAIPARAVSSHAQVILDLVRTQIARAFCEDEVVELRWLALLGSAEMSALPHQRAASSAQVLVKASGIVPLIR